MILSVRKLLLGILLTAMVQTGRAAEIADVASSSSSNSFGRTAIGIG
jgi:hypothetical protein